ncbi:NUDIX domain-containing protein [Streptomyces spectabilis]|nr:NUDIX hydrolase [Streptomyces spectabilis]
MSENSIAPQPAVTPVVAAATLIEHEGRLLLVHHARTGYWVVPGGKAEGRETPRECARREAREEIGVPVTVGRLLAFQHLPGGTYGIGDKPMPCLLFVFAGTIDPADRSRVRIPEGELLGFDWVEPDRAVRLTDATNTELLTAAVQAAANGTAAYLEVAPPASSQRAVSGRRTAEPGVALTATPHH